MCPAVVPRRFRVRRDQGASWRLFPALELSVHVDNVSRSSSQPVVHPRWSASEVACRRAIGECRPAILTSSMRGSSTVRASATHEEHREAQVTLPHPRVRPTWRRGEAELSHGDDDLPSGLSRLQISNRLGNLAQRERPVDDRRHLPGFDQVLQDVEAVSGVLGAAERNGDPRLRTDRARSGRTSPRG
jgi:hypothetical protein